MIAAPEWMISDGSFRLLRDLSVRGIDAESVPVSSWEPSPSAVAEHFTVAGPDYGLEPGEVLLDDAGREFDAVRGLVLRSGPCVVVDDVTHLLGAVPNHYRGYLATEEDTPIVTQETEVVIRPAERAETEHPVIVPTPRTSPWVYPAGLTVAVVALVIVLWYLW